MMGILARSMNFHIEEAYSSKIDAVKEVRTVRGMALNIKWVERRVAKVGCWSSLMDLKGVNA